MKISIVGPVYPYRGGIAHHTTELIKTAKKMGHNVQVVSFLRQYPTWLYPGKSDRDPSRKDILPDSQFILDPLNPFSWVKTIRVIEMVQPNVVVFQWWNPFWSPSFSMIANQLRRKKIKVCYLVHNVMPHESNPLDKFLTRIALLNADSYIVQSEREHKRLETIMPGSIIMDCPHPVYELPGGCKPSKADARKQLGIPLDAPVLLFFGIVRPYKGLTHLIEAMGLLRGISPQLQLLVAGVFWGGTGGYTDRIAKLSLEHQIHIENRYIPDEEVSLYFSAADLFVAPYVDGTQSGAVKLAIGAGLPLLITRPLASEDLMNCPSAVMVIPPADSVSLAEGIRKWLQGEWVPDPANLPQPGWELMVQKIVSMAGAIV